MRATTLQPRRLAQRRVDAVLPARAFLLKEVEHVAVDAQGDHLLGARQRRLALARDRLRRLGGRRLERRFGGGTRVGRSTRSVGCHGVAPAHPLSSTCPVMSANAGIHVSSIGKRSKTWMAGT